MGIAITSIDPGVTCGFGTYDDNGKYTAFQNKIGKHILLYSMLKAMEPRVILYEAFHWRQNQLNTVFTGVEYIGVIELYAQQHNIDAITITPADGKGFWTNDKIMALGLWSTGRPHAMDALRILLRHQMKDRNFMNTILLPKLKTAFG